MRATTFVLSIPVWTCLSALSAAPGCNLLGPRGPSAGGPGGTPTLDRMMKTYEDLASRKFQVLADFETPAQATLFHREPPRGGGQVELTTRQSRRETGVGGLRMAFTDSSQRVWAADTPEGQWALLRDWTPYNLLIFSVFSPRALSGFHFSAHSGTDVPLTYAAPRIALEPGWNLVRIDLGLLSDQINLADVRELRFWCDPLESPIELCLDDLILVNNAKQVFGSSPAAPGELYVRAEGARLVVGSGERFELVFSEGIIRQWFDLGSDPLKARNLAGGFPLGPVPVAVPDSLAAVGFAEGVLEAAAPGPSVQTRQELIEATPLRVVVQAQWQSRQEGEPDATEPARRWLYTVLRDGRVYVECSGSTRGLEGPNGVGVALGCDGDSGFKLAMTPGGDDPSGGHEPYALFGRAERGRADLLVVPHGPVNGWPVQQAGDPRLYVLWRATLTRERFQFAGLLRVWPPDMDGPAQAAPLLADYRHPLPMLVDAGGLARGEPGDFDNDGFSEGRGHYALQLDGGFAKVRVSGRRYVRFSPVFRVRDVAARDVWVYVNGRQIETFRESRGDVIFEVAGAISGEVLVEIASREKSAR